MPLGMPSDSIPST